MKRKLVGLTLAAALAVAPYAATAETNEVIAEPVVVEEAVSVNINGQLIDFPDVKPFINDELGKTYVPIRFIGEALNAQVDWVDDHAELVKGDTLIKIWIDNPEILVNDEAVTIDAPAILVDNIRTMVPLQFISEVLGEEVALVGRRVIDRLRDQRRARMRRVGEEAGVDHEAPQPLGPLLRKAAVGSRIADFGSRRQLAVAHFLEAQ